MRDADGKIVPVEDVPDELKDLSPSTEAVFAGVVEKVPRHVGQLVRCYYCLFDVGRSALMPAITDNELGRPYANAGS